MRDNHAILILQVVFQASQLLEKQMQRCIVDMIVLTNLVCVLFGPNNSVFRRRTKYQINAILSYTPVGIEVMGLLKWHCMVTQSFFLATCKFNMLIRQSGYPALICG